jgi:hypothetical protein
VCKTLRMDSRLNRQGSVGSKGVNARGDAHGMRHCNNQCFRKLSAGIFLIRFFSFNI